MKRLIEMRNVTMLATSLLALGLLFVESVSAQDKMTREQYKMEMADLDVREGAAQAEITRLESQIAALKSDIDAVDADAGSVRGNTLSLLGVSEREFKAAEKSLRSMLKQLDGLSALAPEERFHQRGELDDIEARLAIVKKRKLASHPDLAHLIARVDGMLKDLRSGMPRQMSIDYTVVRGDNLWNIAKKDDIYADPYMWPRLYRANREAIKDPDLIYPKQTLAVPFGVSENQYLVTRGDFLSKIAAAVYNDPTKWHKIYQANKEQIVGPNLVFPAQVFDVPSN
jgi:nucleoid-associated protein YgaU